MWQHSATAAQRYLYPDRCAILPAITATGVLLFWDIRVSNSNARTASRSNRSELLGIKLTVGIFVRSEGCLLMIDAPEGWRAARGPVLIALGVVVGLTGNITSLFVIP